MSKLFKTLLTLVAVIGVSVAQNSGPRVGTILANNISLSGPFQTTYKILAQPGYAKGYLVIKFVNIGGSPSGCGVTINYGSTLSLTTELGPLAATTELFNSTGSGSTYLQFRGPKNYSGAMGPFPAASVQWSCSVTYPQGGSASFELVLDAVPDFAWTHVTSNTSTTTGCGQGCVVHTLVIGAAGTSETITLWDNSAACSGTSLAVITPIAGATYTFDATLLNGLCIQTAGTTAGDYTVTWRQ